jgi:hypothetical protein
MSMAGKGKRHDHPGLIMGQQNILDSAKNTTCMKACTIMQFCEIKRTCDRNYNSGQRPAATALRSVDSTRRLIIASDCRDAHPPKQNVTILPP